MNDLDRAVAAVLRAIHEPGPHPEHHLATLVKHRTEWPALWAALDRLEAVTLEGARP